MILIDVTFVKMIQVIVSSLGGMLGIGAGLSKFLITDTTLPERFLLIGGGLAMLIPGTATDLVGFAVLIVVFLLQKMRLKRGGRPA